MASSYRRSSRGYLREVDVGADVSSIAAANLLEEPWPHRCDSAAGDEPEHRTAAARLASLPLPAMASFAAPSRSCS